MKRLLPLLLSLTMIASVFAGCGSPSASSAPADSAASSAAAPAPTEPAAPADESASFDSAAESASMEEPADGEDGWAYTPISYPLADTPAPWITGLSGSCPPPPGIAMSASTLPSRSWRMPPAYI